MTLDPHRRTATTTPVSDLPARPSPATRARAYGLDVLRAASVDLVGRALSGLLLLAAAGLGVLIWKGGSVPAWAATLVVVVVLAIALALGVRGGRHARRIKELEELTADYDDLEDAVGAYASAVDRYEVYSDHVADVLDRMQRVVTGELEGVGIPDYIERGILAPARDVLQGPYEDIRISVLLADENDRWHMIWAAGHSLDGQRKFNPKITDTLASVAYESGEPQYWPDVAQDDRFKPIPAATRPFHSMLSHPIRRGLDTVGVLNVVSSLADAFDPAEQRYLASLASVIGVAVGVHLASVHDGEE